MLLRDLDDRTGADRGAAATIVALLLAGGVLLGMSALVVDVGQLYAEREELLSVADATAMNTALDCAMERDQCSEEDALDQADDIYASQIARDGLAEVLVCGTDPGLPDCDDPDFDPAGNLTDCLGERPTDGPNYVEVRTLTLTATSTLLPPTFAQAVVPGYEGARVAACSRVAYGAPAGGLAVTIATCEFDGSTDGNTNFPPEGASDDTLRDYETIVYLHDSHGSADCFNGPPHFDGPGGFGWLDGSDCLVEIVDGTYPGDPGNDASQDCRTAIIDAFNSGTPVAIPIFREVVDTGHLTYTLEGIAAFVVTGYRISGSPNLTEPSKLGTGNGCVGQERCLIGYFTKALVEDAGGPIGGVPSLGAVVVRTIG